MDGTGEARAWASGAVVALVAGGAGVAAHLSLRAASTPTSTIAPGVALGVLALTLVLWPLAARATRIRTLAAVLALAQFGAQALAVLTAGASAGPRSLICCPSGEQARPGGLGELTAHAGWTLVAVQLLACLLLAGVVRSGRAGADLVAGAVLLVRALLDAGCARLAARVLAWARGVARADHRRPHGFPPQSTARVRDSGRVLARRTTRRGPPRRSVPVSAGGRAVLAPRSLFPATG